MKTKYLSIVFALLALVGCGKTDSNKQPNNYNGRYYPSGGYCIDRQTNQPTNPIYCQGVGGGNGYPEACAGYYSITPPPNPPQTIYCSSGFVGGGMSSCSGRQLYRLSDGQLVTCQ